MSRPEAELSATGAKPQTLAGVVNFLSDPNRPIDPKLRAVMTTAHLGDAIPSFASAARELFIKSENERAGVLSTQCRF